MAGSQQGEKKVGEVKTIDLWKTETKFDAAPSVHFWNWEGSIFFFAQI